MLKKIEAVIFDLDGVICSTDEYHYEAWKSIADSIGVPFDRTVNNRLRGISRMNSLEIILERYPGQLSQAEKEALAEQKNEQYKTLLMQMGQKDLSADTKDTLDTLRKAGYLLAIGSSSKNTPLILRQIGLEGFFDAVADGNQITHSKPDPEVFLLAAQLLGVKRKNAWWSRTPYPVRKPPMPGICWLPALATQALWGQAIIICVSFLSLYPF